MKVTVSRKAHFNAAHRLFRPQWSDEKNREVFGKCSNPKYHGHNYELIVSIKGEVDPVTGYVIDLKFLKKIIAEEVEADFDHKNLNEEVAAFKDVNPTVENIAIVIWNRLKTRIEASLELTITLYETDRNFVSYSGN